MIQSYLPSSFSRREKFFMSHEKLVAFKIFEKPEACSTRGGRYSFKLRESMINRRRKPSGYVSLPELGTLRAAEVYDGGSHYKNRKVMCSSSHGTVQLSYEEPPMPVRPSTPLSEKERTANLVDHLQQYFEKEGIPLEVVTQKKDVSYSNLCRFSGGGDVTLISRNGPLVIGVPTGDVDEVTPLKKGDMATTSSIENKLATNSQSYPDTEQQLFANMLLSSTEAFIARLLDGSVDPNEVNHVIAYGTIWNPDLMWSHCIN